MDSPPQGRSPAPKSLGTEQPTCSACIRVLNSISSASTTETHMYMYVCVNVQIIQHKQGFEQLRYKRMYMYVCTYTHRNKCA
jgi:hypothetical protein